MLDDALISHFVLWFIGALTLVGGVLTVGAFWSLGRAGYRKVE
ncbi:hypothetical protein M4I32_03360 [Microbacterium sp. LRZ72]|nr:hypothetical protein [Microbacterium sp. LRZ72]MDX2375834.1 hypothetical protein [Microbacterium sp. LRZ72]